jgi:hypothetical protein
MIYTKHARAGFVGAALAVVGWIVVLFLSVALDLARSRQAGVGAVSILVDTKQLLIAAVIGFAAGWYWCVRRMRR